ncbi:MAG: deoxyguanosinetriphosphate triphosphohydrolase [Dialister invisus]|uniref:deoxyguanosinetriphosphate triphosphohydrolase n=1 Tax=Dialister invisus TaxID=218538 RepID=UPI0039952239
MLIRERTEELEKKLLSPKAAFSADAKRSREETEDPMRTKFQRDRDRILHSNSFRRLKHKTQVYIAPEGDHYRTRMTHTLEVAQIGRTMARALRLNENLVEAIAMGHDLGHTPFGHVGEQALRDVCGHFEHNEQSVRIVECLENDGKGLNLTREVKDGMLNHSGNLKAHTLEGGLIKYADRIAYLCHDYDDAENMGLISAKELPDRVRRVLGTTHSSMITAMVQNLVENSMDEDTIHMDKEGDEVLLEFRSFMFDRVYMSQPLIPERKRGHGVVVMLYEWYMSHPDELPEKQKKLAQGNISLAARDYISGLTDNFAINLFKEKYMPKYWNL